MVVEIRVATALDATAIDMLAMSARTDVEREPAQWLTLRGAPSAGIAGLPVVFVAVDDLDDVFGCAGLDRGDLDGSETWWMPALLVDADRRREGAARGLISAVLQCAESLDDELPVVWRVAADNAPMNALSRDLAGDPVAHVTSARGTSYCTFVVYTFSQ